MVNIDKSARKIIDTFHEECNISKRDMCLLNHDNNHFKMYIYGDIIEDDICNVIEKIWNVDKNNIVIKESPKCWFSFGSKGHTIEVKY